MPNRPLLRSRLVAALAKRTLLASSSAFLRSSAVRSGARLNIDTLVYHRHGQPGVAKGEGRAGRGPRSPGTAMGSEEGALTGFARRLGRRLGRRRRRARRKGRATGRTTPATCSIIALRNSPESPFLRSSANLFGPSYSVDWSLPIGTTRWPSLSTAPTLTHFLGLNPYRDGSVRER